MGKLDQKRFVLIIFVILFTTQLFLTIVGYHFDILSILSTGYVGG